METWLNVLLGLLFLVLGMIGGSEGLGGIAFGDYQLAVSLGITALVLILFDGGLNTSVGSVRQVIYPASLMATVRVAATAGLVAVFGRVIGLRWSEALLLGAVVSSTDAAAVFAVLRGGRLRLKQRVGLIPCAPDPVLAWRHWPAEMHGADGCGKLSYGLGRDAAAVRRPHEIDLRRAGTGGRSTANGRRITTRKSSFTRRCSVRGRSRCSMTPRDPNTCGASRNT